MAINKDKNKSLMITLSNQDLKTLESIVIDLSNDLNIDLTKSQAIGLLIRNYNKPQPKETKQTQPRTQKQNRYNYQAQILALKDKLNVSFTKLADILNIPKTTLKKYAYGQQQPKADNEQKIKNAITRYGIK